ncbi:MAG: hypothetical protein VX541_06645 [Candidatus Poribacteria bacterium]|nr:hypothetical protein [Candidatus Poribacteria bacterium]
MDDILIGIDFDNTIVCYDGVFYETAVERKMIGCDSQCRSKEQVRDYLRGIGKEDQWTLLQGYVYGTCMSRANPFPGVIDFFKLCREKQILTAVVSHKTLFPLNGPKYDLHYVARKWLGDHQIDQVVTQIHFEPTIKDKLHRISQIGCTHFIDDLPEFLAEADFPKGVERFHFDPNCSGFKHQFRRLHSWSEAIKWIASL